METGTERIFEHKDQKTGQVVKMGESEVRRRIRIYRKRLTEAETKVLELQLRNETAETIDKQNKVLRNNEEQLIYWETALTKVTEETATETEETSVLRVAA